MIIWGRNRCTRSLPADCVPFKTIRRGAVAIKHPLTWHRDWEGWMWGRQNKNDIDKQLVKLGRSDDRVDTQTSETI